MTLHAYTFDLIVILLGNACVNCDRACENRPSERKYQNRFSCIKLTINTTLYLSFAAVRPYSEKL